MVTPLVRDLVARRHHLRMSQRELARRLGLAQSAVWRLEAGETELGTERAAAWAEALGLEVAHQLRPRGVLSAAQAEMLDAAVRAAPVMSDAEARTYAAVLGEIVRR